MNYISVIKKILDKLDEHKSLLNDLDQAIGDGDHGTNMVRGFQAVVDDEQNLKDLEPSVLFKKIALILMSKIGGSSGPLIGTFFINLGKTWTGLSQTEIAHAFHAGAMSLQQFGKAELGEKTMVDALNPAVDALSNNVNLPMKAFFEQGYLAAKNGAINTKEMIAKKGRASYLGPRSVGHVDPGAQSIAFIFEALYEVV
ncbi:dihydroxyacetone kinase subunit DhaL [Williamsoniiplasma luminosum]|uniref:Dihydroxyacetone kinase subunit L n=1 Tax=Williamsoniiplasma luminosum TaxID=214888 RepID=A0A2S0NJR7_9MOLU|nr:dihydroxyacetone kinase subunit DhaL [Williamsoniiplasma luminosum]AVP49264.1 MAG: dihydroxyacetone kinase subunit L [Williamsoniiplasma luminosum]